MEIEKEITFEWGLANDPRTETFHDSIVIKADGYFLGWWSPVSGASTATLANFTPEQQRQIITRCLIMWRDDCRADMFKKLGETARKDMVAVEGSNA